MSNHFTEIYIHRQSPITALVHILAEGIPDYGPEHRALQWHFRKYDIKPHTTDSSLDVASQRTLMKNIRN